METDEAGTIAGVSQREPLVCEELDEHLGRHANRRFLSAVDRRDDKVIADDEAI